MKTLYESQVKATKIVRWLFYNCIWSKTKYGEGAKISTPKQMLQRLLIALARVKSGNTSENLLN